MSKCEHANFDEYFDKCTDCDAPLEEVLQDEFKNELQAVYAKMQQALGIEHGDIPPDLAIELDEYQDKLEITVSKWLALARNE